LSGSGKPASPPADFDRHELDYDGALAQGLSVSGEDRDYFARGRVSFLAGWLRRLAFHPVRVMDFGCGRGTATEALRAATGAAEAVGVDVSSRLLEQARRMYASPAVSFRARSEYVADGSLDLVFCNGVFHHIPPEERRAAVRFARDALRPGGLFSFWENNPWNPGARYVMSRIPFDRGARMVWPGEARRRLREEGLEVLGTDFLFIFPRPLRWLRALEPPLSRLPLGAQYQVIARRPPGRAAEGRRL
jgi:SAM-dependent methyltransferase